VLQHLWTAADQLAQIRSEADVVRPELLLVQAGPVTVRYCPFDYVNPFSLRRRPMAH
jgi:hypothetical protein